MKFNSTMRSWLVAMGMSVAAAGCGSGQEDPSVPASEAAIKFAFGTIPDDVLCVEARVTGSTRTAVKHEDVFPGDSATLFMGGLPTGEVTFDALAYPVPCSEVKEQGSLPTWISDSENAFLQGGVVTPVSLTLRPNGVAAVDVDFQPDQPAGQLEFEPGFHEFGFVPPGSSSSKTFSLVNRSRGAAFAKVFVRGEGFFIDKTDCDRPLRPMGSCTVGVRFSPQFGSHFYGELVADTGRTQALAYVSGTSVGEPPPPPGPGLIGHWRFDKSRNMFPFVTDLSGNGNTGVVVRGTDPNAEPTEPNLVPGRNGETAIDLSNQTWVRVKSSDSINQTGNNQAFTLASWVSTKAPLAEEETIIARQEFGTSFKHFGLGLQNGQPTGQVHFFFASAPEQMPRDGSWHHLATTYDGIDLKVFVDGKVTTMTSIGWPIAADTTDVTLGASQELGGVTDFFSGVLDDAQIYDTSLSESDVASLAGQK